jgi:hypothetical protein
MIYTNTKMDVEIETLMIHYAGPYARRRFKTFKKTHVVPSDVRTYSEQ